MNKLYVTSKTKSDIAALLKRVRALVEGMTAVPAHEAPDDYATKAAAALLGKQDPRFAPAVTAAISASDHAALLAAMQGLGPQDDALGAAALAQLLREKAR
ncbi:MAG TPA: hypothetical protein VNF74_16245 [Terriglobales bacterium]|nr:hypothetical protein [Terriglobales bacterium]